MGKTTIGLLQKSAVYDRMKGMRAQISPRRGKEEDNHEIRFFPLG
jgi:hypothetical protein